VNGGAGETTNVHEILSFLRLSGSQLLGFIKGFFKVART
jgi:hypothetical protein